MCVQGKIVYEMIGEFPAKKYFFVEKNSGVIRTRGNIKSDPLKLMSYTVRRLPHGATLGHQHSSALS